ncbi:MAG: nuclear transport factor 2 family protein [Chloroflexi bacterium]|nr:nuclear transport factor 2 family protein [Chloroflexota bacterium]
MNTKSKYLFLFVLLSSILTACGAPAPAATDPVTIAQGFWDAVHAKNVDAAMAFVANDVVTDGLPAHFTNKADFSAFMVSTVEDGDTFEITDLKLDSEDTVTYTISVDLKGNTEAFSGLGKLQVKDGKIVYIEFP